MTEEERLLQEMMARQNKFYGRFPYGSFAETSARPAVVTPRVSTPARTITNTVEQQKVLKDLAKSKSFRPSSPTTKWSTDAVSKVPSMAKLVPGLGAAATIYDAFRPSQLASAADATANPGTDFRVTQAYPSMDNVYTDPTAMAYAGVTPPGEEFGSSYAGPNTMQVGDWTQGGVHHAGGYELGPAVDSRFMNNEGVLTGGVPAVDYSQMAQDWGDPTTMSAPTDPTGGLAATDPSLQGITDQSLASLSGNFPAGLGGSGYISPTADDTVIGQSWDASFPEIAPDFSSDYAYTGMGDLQSHPGQGTGYDAGFGTTGATYAGLMGEIANLPHSEVGLTKQGLFEEGSMILPYIGKIASSKVDTYDVQNTPLYDAMVAINNQNPSNMPFDAPNVLGALTTGTDPLMDLNVAQDWANEINALRSGTWGVDPTTQAVTFEDYLTELGPASGPNIPFGKTTGTVTPTPADIHPAMQNVDYGAALADPNISAQATIDDFTERQIAQDMSSYPQFASTQETVPLPAAPVSAPMAPRQQAMPEVSIPDALARQDVRTAMAAMAPRQDAMPQAPAGPTPAQIAAQVAAAEQSHRDQQASARQALNDFYASREYQEGGGSAPAGMIDMASGVDTFASGNPFAEAMVAAQVNAAGGMEFGGAGGMAGSGRGGGGRGSRGGGRE